MVKNRFKALREDSDQTQQALADILHISRSTYSAYENHANAPPLEILFALADHYQTSIDYLLYRTNDPTPYPQK